MHPNMANTAKRLRGPAGPVTDGQGEDFDPLPLRIIEGHLRTIEHDFERCERFVEMIDDLLFGPVPATATPHANRERPCGVLPAVAHDLGELHGRTRALWCRLETIAQQLGIPSTEVD